MSKSRTALRVHCEETWSERIAAPFWWFTDWLFGRRRKPVDGRRFRIKAALSAPVVVQRHRSVVVQSSNPFLGTLGDQQRIAMAQQYGFPGQVIPVQRQPSLSDMLGGLGSVLGSVLTAPSVQLPEAKTPQRRAGDLGHGRTPEQE